MARSSSSNFTANKQFYTAKDLQFIRQDHRGMSPIALDSPRRLPAGSRPIEPPLDVLEDSDDEVTTGDRERLLQPALQEAERSSQTRPSTGAQTNEAYNSYQAFALDDGNLPWAEGWFALDFDKFLAYRNKQPIRYTTHRQSGSVIPYEFCLVGCQGVGNTRFQKRNAANMLNLIPHQVENVRTGSERTWLLGDTVYQFGVDSPISSAFMENFDWYFKKKPAFLILGNHDYNIHSWAHLKRWRSKLHSAMCQVFHFYIKRWEVDPLKPQTEVNRWNMPFRYYSLTSHKHKVHFIAIDSNTIVFDVAQQKWLVELYEELDRAFMGYNFILISHHPLDYFSKRQNEGLGGRRRCGTRASKPDEWKKYVQTVPGSGLSQTPCYWANAQWTGARTEIPGVQENADAVPRNNTIDRAQSGTRQARGR